MFLTKFNEEKYVKDRISENCEDSTYKLQYKCNLFCGWCRYKF